MAYKTRVLFVCTANAARSQMAEALLRHTDSDYFEAHSAGSQPGEVDPRALAALQHLGVNTEGLHSKGLDAFHWNDFEYVISLPGMPAPPLRRSAPGLVLRGPGDQHPARGIPPLPARDPRADQDVRAGQDQALR